MKIWIEPHLVSLFYVSCIWKTWSVNLHQHLCWVLLSVWTETNSIEIVQPKGTLGCPTEEGMVFVEHNCAVDVQPLIEWSRMAWVAIRSCFCRSSSWFLRWGRGSLKVEFFQTSERSERVRVEERNLKGTSIPHWKNQLELPKHPLLLAGSFLHKDSY